MSSKSKHSYNSYFAHEAVGRALHWVLKNKVNENELPISLYENLEDYKNSNFWKSNIPDGNIWDEIVIKILDNELPQVNSSSKTIKKYSQFIYCRSCRDFGKIKQYYDEEKTKERESEICQPKECESLFTVVKKTSDYSIHFTAQSVAQAIFDVLKEEPYNVKIYADFDEFHKSNVWRKYVSLDNLWHRVTLSVLHRSRVTPSVLQKYAAKLYVLMNNEGNPFDRIKECYSKIAKNPAVDEISVQLQQVAIESDDQRDEVNNNESLMNLFDLDQYPPEFPNLKNNIAGIEINVPSFQSLEPTEELDDNVINAFLLSIAEGSAKKVIPFETFLTSNILDLGYVSRGYNTWLTRAGIWGNCAWLWPTHCTVRKAGHWSLFIILPDDKLIVFLCSLHRNPKRDWIANICAFLDTYSAQQIQWEDWKIFSPKDIPTQTSTTVKNSANNCGVHVCLWAYILSSGIYRPYSEKDMNTFRKGIAWILMNTHLTRKSSEKIVNTRRAVLDGSRVQLELTGSDKLLKKSKSLNDSSCTNTLEYLSSWMQR